MSFWAKKAKALTYRKDEIATRLVASTSVQRECVKQSVVTKHICSLCRRNKEMLYRMTYAMGFSFHRNNSIVISTTFSRSQVLRTGGASTGGLAYVFLNKIRRRLISGLIRQIDIVVERLIDLPHVGLA